MPLTFKPIATTTVGSGGAANITFSSIPQTYTDLCILISARSEAAGGFSDEIIKLNNATTTYTNKYIYADGANAFGSGAAYIGSGGFTGGMVGNTSTSNTFSNKCIYIPNYTASVRKAYLVDSVTETNASTAYTHLLAGNYESTSAITSIVLVTDSGVDYAEHTTATLYGISNA